MKMTVMIDTNVIISAALNPKGSASLAMIKALSPPFQPVVCDYIIDELHRKFEEKFPHRITQLEAFLYHALLFIEIIPTPESEYFAEGKIRDVKDRPILRAALAKHVDYLLTGDKDFLESDILTPQMISPSDFLKK